jgi:hypothetical protein
VSPPRQRPFPLVGRGLLHARTPAKYGNGVHKPTSGVSYTGSVRGRHDLWLWALLVTAVVLHGAALLVGLSAAPARVAWVPAALLVPATIALGRGYERELRATLRGNR